jgi:excisionase family DNA binding protein
VAKLVTDRAVYNWLADGTLKGYRLGSRAVRIKRADVDGLLTPYRSES